VKNLPGKFPSSAPTDHCGGFEEVDCRQLRVDRNARCYLLSTINNQRIASRDFATSSQSFGRRGVVRGTGSRRTNHFCRRQSKKPTKSRRPRERRTRHIFARNLAIFCCSW